MHTQNYTYKALVARMRCAWHQPVGM